MSFEQATENIDYLYLRLDTRWNSDNLIKRNMHRCKFEKLLAFLQPGMSLLDVCRGGSVDGVLGVLAAKKGVKVTICNTKPEYLEVIKKFADANNVSLANLVVCSPDKLPFNDSQFDCVSCIHVLEHVENYEKALAEIYRVTQKYALIAMPTCLNLSVFARIGGADYYNFTLKSIPCLLFGFLKVMVSLLLFRQGVYENNEEKGKITKHFQRFPWVVKHLLEEKNFTIVQYGADGFCFPWISSLIAVQRRLDKYAYLPIVRNFGFGTHFYCQKN